MKKEPFIDSQTEALLSLGWINKFDILLFSCIGIVGVFTAYLGVTKGLVPALVSLGVVLFLQLIWLTSLVYRACYYVLMLRSAIETMPDVVAQIAAARIAAGASVPPEMKPKN